MIASNKTVPHSSPLLLYSERIRTIRWLEKHAPQDFDLFGLGWDTPVARHGLVGRLISKWQRHIPKRTGEVFSLLIAVRCLASLILCGSIALVSVMKMFGSCPDISLKKYSTVFCRLRPSLLGVRPISPHTFQKIVSLIAGSLSVMRIFITSWFLWQSRNTLFIRNAFQHS